MSKTQFIFDLVLVALIGVLYVYATGSPARVGGAVYTSDPSITNFTRLSANDFINGGVETIGSRVTSLNQGTSTVCSILSPAATSTLAMGSVEFTVSSTTASTVTLARAATAAASTTFLASASVATSSQADIYAVATSSSNSAYTFPPSTYFNVSMQGVANSGSFSPTGVCTAVFQTLN